MKYRYPAIVRHDSVNDVYYFEFVDFPHTFTAAIDEDELEYVPSEILEMHIINYLDNGIPLPRPTPKARYYHNLNSGDHWRCFQVDI